MFRSTAFYSFFIICIYLLFFFFIFETLSTSNVKEDMMSCPYCSRIILIDLAVVHGI